MDRREFLKMGGAAVGIFLLSLLGKGCFSKGEELTFAKIYPVPFWKTDYFQAAVLITTIAVAGAVSYFTAGAGAPSSATFVSSVASWVGGGAPVLT